MKRFYPLVLLLIVFALVGRTTVTAFIPELNYSATVSSDWAEESEEGEDECDDDDSIFEPVGYIPAVIPSPSIPSSPLSLRLETLPREIPAPPPQA